MDTFRFLFQIGLGLVTLLALLVGLQRWLPQDGHAVPRESFAEAYERINQPHLITAIHAPSDARSQIPPRYHPFSARTQSEQHHDEWQVRWWAETYEPDEDGFRTLFASVVMNWTEGAGDVVDVFPAQGAWSEQAAEHVAGALREEGITPRLKAQIHDPGIDHRRLARTPTAARRQLHDISEQSERLLSEIFPTEDLVTPPEPHMIQNVSIPDVRAAAARVRTVGAPQWHTWALTRRERDGWSGRFIMYGLWQAEPGVVTADNALHAEVELHWQPDQRAVLIMPAADALAEQAADVLRTQLRMENVAASRLERADVDRVAAGLRELALQLPSDPAAGPPRLRFSRANDGGWTVRWWAETGGFNDGGAKAIAASLAVWLPAEDVLADAASPAALPVRLQAAEGPWSEEAVARLASDLASAGLVVEQVEDLQLPPDLAEDRLAGPVHCYRLLNHVWLREFGYETPVPSHLAGRGGDWAWRIDVRRIGDRIEVLPVQPEDLRYPRPPLNPPQTDASDLRLAWHAQRGTLVIEPRGSRWSDEVADRIAHLARQHNIRIEFADPQPRGEGPSRQRAHAQE